MARVTVVAAFPFDVEAFLLIVLPTFLAVPDAVEVFFANGISNFQTVPDVVGIPDVSFPGFFVSFCCWLPCSCWCTCSCW